MLATAANSVTLALQLPRGSPTVALVKADVHITDFVTLPKNMLDRKEGKRLHSVFQGNAAELVGNTE